MLSRLIEEIPHALVTSRDHPVLSKKSRCDTAIKNQRVNQALTLNICSIKINFAMFFVWRLLLKRLMWPILIKIFYVLSKNFW
jgi:hypothetical protein